MFDMSGVLDMLGLCLIGVSVYRLARRDFPQFVDAKAVLMSSNLSFAGVLFFDLLQQAYGGPRLALTVGGTLSVLFAALFLTSLAYVVRARPAEPTFAGRVKAIVGSRFLPHGLVIFGFSAYILFLGLYLALYSPVSVAPFVTLTGAVVLSYIFTPGYVLLLLPVLLLFLGYTCASTFVAGRRSDDPPTRRALAALGIAWAVIGVLVFVTDGPLLWLGIDAKTPGWVAASVLFVMTTNSFGRTTILDVLFRQSARATKAADPFSARLQGGTVEGKATLLEVDPSANYEVAVKDFATEMASHGSSLFVFTSAGSPVHGALSDIPEARFFLLTTRVSSPKLTGNQREVLLPSNDEAVLLDTIEKVVNRDREARIAIVLDNISDMVVLSGVEWAYRLLKETNELLDIPRTTALFIIMSRAHNKEMLSLLTSLYGGHLMFDASGLARIR